MYKFNEIKTVHLEVTERCNASCPMCARNINGGDLNPHIREAELSLDNIKKIFSLDFLQQLSHIYLCGNYGDPIVAKDTLDILRYFRECNQNLLLSINTNGSARNTEWWRSLAEILGSNGYVVFSVDGLSDTNHIYRQNTNFDTIMRNATTFIEAGGKAKWEFIVFAHNEHQVETARQLSKDMHFAEFATKKTARFISPLNGVEKEISVINTKNGQIKLGLPKNKDFVNKAVNDISKFTGSEQEIVLPTKVQQIQHRLRPEIYSTDQSKKSEIEKYWDVVKIDCKVAKEKNLYITAEGIVQPCCWMAGQMYSWYYSYRSTQIWKYINKVGLKNLNAIENDVGKIVDGIYFQEIIPSIWDKPSCSEGKLAVCSKTCGVTHNVFDEQYT